MFNAQNVQGKGAISFHAFKRSLSFLLEPTEARLEIAPERGLLFHVSAPATL
jgi:hypothetical protein